MEKKLPHSVLHRPKIGFDIPIHEWFRGVLRPLLLDTLTEEAVTSTGLFHWPYVRRLLDDHLERRATLVSLMGTFGPVHLDEALEHRNGDRGTGSGREHAERNRRSRSLPASSSS